MEVIDIKYIYTIFLGIFVGIVTLLGQSILPMNLNFLANSGAIWLIPAYFVAKYGKSIWSSIMHSILELECCVFGYYIFEAIYNKHAFSIIAGMLVWIICGVIGGIVIGFASYYSETEKGILSIFSKSILSAIFLSEGISKLIHISDYAHMIPAVIMVTLIVFFLYFIINRKESFNRKNILGVLVTTVLGLIFYEIIYKIM